MAGTMNPLRLHLRQSYRLGVIAALAAAATTGALEAQSAAGTHRRLATRDDLKVALQAAERAASASEPKERQKHERDAAAIRSRLESGDFLPGHRILLQVSGGDSVLSDTFTVRMDQRLALPRMGDIALRGVLDSELEPHLTREISRYIRQPIVTATGLIRVQVTGGIGRPGFHVVPGEMTVTDLIMAAGGPVAGVNLRSTQVRRGSETVADAKAFTSMMQLGMTVSAMGLRDGDEIRLPEGASSSNMWATKVAPIMAGLGTILFVIRRM